MPRILSVFLRRGINGAAWMAGTSPAMTAVSLINGWHHPFARLFIAHCTPNLSVKLP